MPYWSHYSVIRFLNEDVPDEMSNWRCHPLPGETSVFVTEDKVWKALFVAQRRQPFPSSGGNSFPIYTVLLGKPGIGVVSSICSPTSPPLPVPRPSVGRDVFPPCMVSILEWLQVLRGKVGILNQLLLSHTTSLSRLKNKRVIIDSDPKINVWSSIQTQK